jgi:hypothetical protein
MAFTCSIAALYVRAIKSTWERVQRKTCPGLGINAEGSKGQAKSGHAVNEDGVLR